jgi:hypothetical protein
MNIMKDLVVDHLYQLNTLPKIDLVQCLVQTNFLLVQCFVCKFLDFLGGGHFVFILVFYWK